MCTDANGAESKADNVSSGNTNQAELANELAECRKVADLKSVRSRFEAAAINNEVPVPRARPSSGVPRRAVSMQNVGAELSVAPTPEPVSSAQNGVADELELCRQRAVTKQLKSKFADGNTDAREQSQNNKLPELPSNGLARKMAALFQSSAADADANADADIDGILV